MGEDLGGGGSEPREPVAIDRELLSGAKDRLGSIDALWPTNNPGLEI
jgi:hypothetical protein